MCFGQTPDANEIVSLTVTYQKDTILKSTDSSVLRLYGRKYLEQTSIEIPNYILQFSITTLNKVDTIRVKNYIFVTAPSGIRIQNSESNSDTIVTFAKLKILDYLTDSLVLNNGLLLRRTFNGVRFDLNSEISFGFTLDEQKAQLSDLYLLDKRSKIGILSYSFNKKIAYSVYYDSSINIANHKAFLTDTNLTPIIFNHDLARLKIKRNKISEIYYIKDGAGYRLTKNGQTKYIGQVSSPVKSDVLINISP
jgi:hypothetical protein